VAKTNQKQFQAAWEQAWLEDSEEKARMLLVESCMGFVCCAKERVRGCFAFRAFYTRIANRKFAQSSIICRRFSSMSPRR